MDPVLPDEAIDENDSSDINTLNIRDLIIANSLENLGETKENSECEYESCHKPTLSNFCPSKNRKHAFSSQKSVSPSTDSRQKTSTISMHNNDTSKVSPMKGEINLKEAKSIIEEIELLKKMEFPNQEFFDKDFTFRKRDRKERNYRRSDTSRRSPSPIVTKDKERHVEKSSRRKQPQTWEEFKKDNWTFDRLHKYSTFHEKRRLSTLNDFSRQLRFENPALPIKPYHYKSEKEDDKEIGSHFLRVTMAQPKIAYNVNLAKIKEPHYTRDEVLKRTHSHFREIFEKFLSKSTKTKLKATEHMGQRNWYQKNWNENESKVLETSIGLSFLQTYSDDDDEDDELLFNFGELTKSFKTQDKSKKDTELAKKSEVEQQVAKQPKKKKRAKMSFENGSEGELFPTSSEYDIEEYTPKNDLSLNNTPAYSIDHELNRINSTMQTISEEYALNNTEASWTPERLDITPDTFQLEIPKPKENQREEQKTETHSIPLEIPKSKGQKINSERIDPKPEDIEEKHKAQEILSRDEWEETPKRKTENSNSAEVEIKKHKKKKKKSGVEINSPLVKKLSKKKKKNSEKRKKLKLKEKKAKKKEKLRAKKLKLKKQKKKKQEEKERRVEREILKKLKKEIEMNLEQVEREQRELKDKVEEAEDTIELKTDEAVQVKVEEQDSREEQRPPEDLRNFLDKKVHKVKDLRAKVEKKKQDRLKTETDKEVKVTCDENKIKGSRKSAKKEINAEDVNVIEHFDETGVCVKIENFVGSFEGNISADMEDIDNNLDMKTVQEEAKEYKDEKMPKLPEIIEKAEDDSMSKTEAKPGEIICKTPDTDEYYSNWESDDGISPIAKISTKKRWDSYEEMFNKAFSDKDSSEQKSSKDIFDKKYSEKSNDRETKRSNRRDSDRKQSVLDKDTEPYGIKKLSKRASNRRESSRSRTRSPQVYFDVDNEIKLLEAERINLSKERMRLEMERIRIHELERKKSMEEIEFICETSLPTNTEADNYRQKSEQRRNRWDVKEDSVDSSTWKNRDVSLTKRCMEGKEEQKLAESTFDTDLTSNSSIIFNVSSSPEITSTKSPTPTVLENAYEEFLKAVSAGDESKDFLVISSTESETEEPVTQQVQQSELEDRISPREQLSLVGTTDPKILQEILLPGEVAAWEKPVPVPVPSPKVDVLQNVAAIPVFNVVELEQETVLDAQSNEPAENTPDTAQAEPLEKKPFSYSSLILPAKKTAVLKNTNWNLEHSDDEMSYTSSTENVKVEQEYSENQMKNERQEKAPDEKFDIDPKDRRNTTDEKVDKRRDSSEKKNYSENRRHDDRLPRKKRSRSRTPLNTPRDKRRREDFRRRSDVNRRRDYDSRRREDDSRKKEDSRRRGKRGLSPTGVREKSPRRRRFASPTRRSQSPKYRSSLSKQTTERKRSQERFSPLRRKRGSSPFRTSSPREKSPKYSSVHTRGSKSPLHSPMDGLKKSVADSTISDDLLPQPYTGESSSSPLGVSLSSRKAMLTLSPKRPSLDERISQVLGVEPEPEPEWKHSANQSYDQSQHMVYQGHLHHQRDNFAANEPTKTSKKFGASKVLQIGNILEVVPSEDIGLLEVQLEPPPPPPPPPTQKILQVGNMIQIVPTETEDIPHPDDIPEGTPSVVPISETEPLETERVNPLVQGALLQTKMRKREKRKRREKLRGMKLQLQMSTEELIQALEMEGLMDDNNEEREGLVPEIISNTPGIDPSKSILSSTISRLGNVYHKRKSVKFADGIRPGEGTSSSSGEAELSSPPPRIPLKVKKHKRIDRVKKKKRKVKVKVLKRSRLQTADSDEEYENLPPPSPPPGSPPPHVFPPRVKVHTINNIPQHYLPSFRITTAPQTNLLSQPPPQGVNLPYQTPPNAVYRTPPPLPPVNVISQHYARPSTSGLLPPSMRGSSSFSHRDHQQYSSF